MAIIEQRGTGDDVRQLAAHISERAEEVELARRLPLDLVERLTAAGCFRSLAPRRYGGTESSLLEHMAMLEELARADGSVGWTVMIGSAAPAILGLLPRSTLDDIYANGPDVILAGAFNPTGVATPVHDGFRVTGRWSFASGCQHAHWFIAHCIVDDGRMPPIRMMVLPAGDVGVEDTWFASGLRGTGSHDFVVDGAFVPADHSFSVVEDRSNLDVPLGRVPELTASTLMIAAVAVGIAGGAMDDIMALATGKVPAFSDTTLAGNALFRHQLGEADATLRAARAALHADAETTWATAQEGAELTLEQRAHVRATNTWVVRTAAAVTDMAYTAGGGSALYAASPLQRRLRDAHALTQHFAVKSDTFTLAGAVLAGQDVDVTFL